MDKSRVHEDVARVFKAWQEYIEFADKLQKIFMTNIPESLLPYPRDTIERVLSIVAKDCHDRGDLIMQEAIETTMCFQLSCHKEDSEALDGIINLMEMASNDPKLKVALLDKLKEARESWFKDRKK